MVRVNKSAFGSLTFPDGSVHAIGTNLGEMLGGAGKGLRLRQEEKLRSTN